MTNYHDVIDTAIAWNGDFEGVGVSLTYGYVGGNTKIVNATEYNDLENHIYSAKLTMLELLLSTEITRRLWSFKSCRK